MTIPFPPKSEVTERTIEWDTIVQRADPGPEVSVPYEFGGRKRFWSIYQGEGFYDKPVSISGGVTTHLPDPDLIPTNFGQ